MPGHLTVGVLGERGCANTIHESGGDSLRGPVCCALFPSEDGELVLWPFHALLTSEKPIGAPMGQTLLIILSYLLVRFKHYIF